MPTIAPRIPVLWCLLAATLVVAACAPEATETPVPTAIPTVSAESVMQPTAASTAYAQFCDDYLAVSLAYMKSPLTGDEAAVKEMDKAAITAEAQHLADVVKAAQANAPAELAQAFGSVSAVMDEVVVSGDVAKLTDADLMAAGTPIDLWAYDNCGWTQVPVTAKDYAFEGIPATIPAGTVAFKLTNTSTAEQHVILITRRQPGVTGSAKDILAKEGDPFQSDLEVVTATGAPPGGSGATAADLAPGDYIALCPIPQGGTPDGKMHYMLGMYNEFTVK